MTNETLDADCIFEKKKWISVTGLCNNNCLFCLDKGRPDTFHKQIDEILKELNEAREDGATKLIISGGDPSIYPNLKELIEHSKKMGFTKVQIITNGRMFSSNKFTEDLIKAGLDEVTFSLHGHTEKIHDTLTRVPGSFKQIIKGILNVSKYNIIINTDTCITKLNYQSLPEIIKFIHQKLKINEMNLMSMVPQGSAWDNRKLVMYDYEKVAPYIKKIIDYSKQNIIHLWLSRFPGEYLEGYEDYIEDPYKLIDDVRGRYDQLKNSVRPSCKGEKCQYCCVKPICSKLIKINNLEKNVKKDYLVISKETINEIPSTISNQTLKLISPTKRLSDYKKIAPSPEELKQILFNINSKLKKNIFIEGVPPCLIFESGSNFIQNVKHHQNYPAGKKITKKDFLEFSEELSRNVMIKKPECSQCIFDSECEGTYRNYARAHGLEILKPIKQRELRINMKCNQKCDFCNTDENSENVIKGDLFEEVSKSIESGNNYLVLTGKEPTLENNLPEVISHAKQEGATKIELQTNATMCNKEYVEKLKKSGLTHAFISLHANTEELSSKITNSKGLFEKTLTGINNLYDARVSITLNIVINSLNISKIKEIFQFINENLKFHQLSISFFAPVGKGKDNLYLIPDINKYHQILNDGINYLIENEIDFRVPSRCGIPVCLIKPAQKYHDDIISNKKKNISEKQKLPECKTCKFYDKCSGIWNKYLETKSLTKVNPILEKETSSLDLNVGVLCNNNCQFCMTKYPGIKQYFIEYEELAKEIINGASNGCNKITFLGGEPTIHPDIVKLVELAKKNSYSQIHIVSNGRKYSYMNFVQELASKGVNRFSVSIHSHIEKIEDELTERIGAFKEKIKGIENLITISNIMPIESICINFVTNNLNYEAMKESILFFKEKGVKEFRLNSMMNYSGNGKINSKKLLPSFSKIAPIIEDLIKIPNIYISTGDFPLCTFKDWKNTCKYIGECSTDVPTTNVFFNKTNNEKIHKDVFQWSNRKANSLKTFPEVCKNCDIKGFCEGVWKTYIQEKGESEFKAIKLEE